MPPSSASPVNAVRLLAAWLGLAAIIALFISQADRLTDLRVLGLSDYIAYWSAGRLNAWGANPYSPDELLPVQKDLGWPEDWPNIMYYPPWTLPLVMPFGVLPYGPSRLLWLLVHFGLVAFCADRLWRYFRGPEAYRWLAWALAFSFVPTLIVLRMGQIGPLLLLGIVGFLCWEKRGWGWAAGAALLLAAIKPQLVYLFGLGVVSWAVDRRRWSVLAGGVLAGLACMGLALACNPQVLLEYRYALANPPSGNVTPTLGAMLRLILGEEHTWLQFVPTIAGLLWFPFYWRRHRANWEWERQGPVLLLMSFLTTSYGSWVFDLVVLLVPILQAAAWVVTGQDRRLAQWAVAGYLAIDGVALAMNLLGATYPAFIWMTPAILGCYLALRWWREPRLALALQG